MDIGNEAKVIDLSDERYDHVGEIVDMNDCWVFVLFDDADYAIAYRRNELEVDGE